MFFLLLNLLLTSDSGISLAIDVFQSCIFKSKVKPKIKHFIISL